MECTDEMRNKVTEFLQARETGDTGRCEVLMGEFEEQSEETKELVRALLEEALQNEKAEPMLGSGWKPIIVHAPWFRPDDDSNGKSDGC